MDGKTQKSKGGHDQHGRPCTTTHEGIAKEGQQITSKWHEAITPLSFCGRGKGKV